MALRLTLDIFSGRVNPQIVVGGDQERDLLNRLRPGRALRRDDRLEAPATLGYRGLVVEQLGKPSLGLPKSFRVANGDLIGDGLGHKAADEHVEEFVTGSTGPFESVGLGRRFSEHAQHEIARYLDLRERWRHHHVDVPKQETCKAAGLYEPAWWSTEAIRLASNNSYNYAANYRTDNMAQPGMASGVNHNYTCATVIAAAVADGLVDAPNADNHCPEEGHLMALVLSVGWDYHWYRKDRNGQWSHKPGCAPATNIDNNGHGISDPRNATRGSYSKFCTFMVAKVGHLRLGGTWR